MTASLLSSFFPMLFERGASCVVAPPLSYFLLSVFSYFILNSFLLCLRVPSSSKAYSMPYRILGVSNLSSSTSLVAS